MSPFAYNSNLADDLAILPLSSKQQTDMIKKYRSLETACHKGDAFKIFRSVYNIKPKSDDSEKPSKSSGKQKLI